MFQYVTLHFSVIDMCESNPCENDGECVSEVNSFTCDCDGTRYTGEHCEEGEYIPMCIQYSVVRSVHVS